MQHVSMCFWIFQDGFSIFIKFIVMMRHFFFICLIPVILSGRIWTQTSSLVLSGSDRAKMWDLFTTPPRKLKEILCWHPESNRHERKLQFSLSVRLADFWKSIPILFSDISNYHYLPPTQKNDGKNCLIHFPWFCKLPS